MVDVSVVLPARNEQFLTPTIENLVRSARADTEIIAVLEGYWPDRIVDDPRVHYIHNGTPLGMRGAINAGVAIAKGKYLLKLDAHCAISDGYDEILMADCEPNWVVVPRRYSLEPETWRCKPKHPIDYNYLGFPDDPNDWGGPSLHGKEWRTRDNERAEVEIDDLMSSQGSCWFMHRDYFHWLDLMDAEAYGTFWNEFQEIGLKVWLSGGRCKVNKRVWYAHLHKGHKYGRGYHLPTELLYQGTSMTNKWMDGRNWRRQDRDLRWLIHEFWPAPTWPETAVRLVFHRRRGDSGEVRGTQIAQKLKARLNPAEDWHYDFDVNVWVKQEPRHLEWPGKHYLDVIDAHERIGWLREHPEIGVIAMSQSGQAYLNEVLGRDDVIFIPVHHCNVNRVWRPEREIKVAGVCGRPDAISCNLDALSAMLKKLGIEFRHLQTYQTVQDIVDFYKGLDVQIVWRLKDRALKEPLKLVNAMSFGIPTIAKPESAWTEVDGYYWPVESVDDIGQQIEALRQGYDAQRLIDKAEEYHIDHVPEWYKVLL